MVKIKESIALNVIYQRISKAFPNLKLKLKQAGMEDKPEEFVKKTFISAFYMTTGIVVFTFLVLAKLNLFRGILLLIVPIINNITKAKIVPINKGFIVLKKKKGSIGNNPPITKANPLIKPIFLGSSNFWHIPNFS